MMEDIPLRKLETTHRLPKRRNLEKEPASFIVRCSVKGTKLTMNPEIVRFAEWIWWKKSVHNPPALNIFVRCVVREIRLMTNPEIARFVGWIWFRLSPMCLPKKSLIKKC